MLEAVKIKELINEIKEKSKKIETIGVARKGVWFNRCNNLRELRDYEPI